TIIEEDRFDASRSGGRHRIYMRCFERGVGGFDVDDFGAETDFAAAVNDMLYNSAADAGEAVAADVGFGVDEDVGVGAEADELFEDDSVVGIMGAGIEFAVAVGSGAADAEEEVVFRVELA